MKHKNIFFVKVTNHIAKNKKTSWLVNYQEIKSIYVIYEHKKVVYAVYLYGESHTFFVNEISKKDYERLKKL